MVRERLVKKGMYWGRGLPEPREWGGRLPIALIYPNRSSMGISTLGWQAVYRLLSEQDEFVVERFFTDSPEQGVESHDFRNHLSRFPLVAVSLTYEFDVQGLIQILDQARLPLLSKERNDWPMILAGGPLTFLNAAPIQPSLDGLLVGEADQDMVRIFSAIREHWFEGKTKDESLEAISGFDALYVPGKSSVPVKRRVARTECKGLIDPAFSCFISARAEFKDTLLLEINRGCPHGCRFCAAGYIYRPPRTADMDELIRIVEATDPPKVGLVGTALTDWSDLLSFLQWLHSRKTKFSLSSLRADQVSEELLTFLRHTGTRSLTFALEGVSRRLRQAMNKQLDEDRFLQAVSLASQLRFNHLKIYLIVGWPGEEDKDFDELESFLALLEDARNRGRGKKKSGLERMTLSVSCLVPKPWTPMQWAPMAGEDDLRKCLERIKNMTRRYSGVRFSGEAPFSSRLQGLLARGDESVHELILLAHKNGGSWRRALKQWSGSMDDYLKERDKDEKFPWEVVDIGVDREYLWSEWVKFKEGVPSSICPEECGMCRKCGMQRFFERDIG